MRAPTEHRHVDRYGQILPACKLPERARASEDPLHNSLLPERNPHETLRCSHHRLRQRRKDPGRGAGGRGQERRRDRAIVPHVRRHLHQRGLHPHEDPRARRRAVAGTGRHVRRTRRALRRRHRREGSRDRHAARQELPQAGRCAERRRHRRPRLVRGRDAPRHRAGSGGRRHNRRHRSRAPADRSRSHLHQHWRAPLRAAHPRHRQPARVRQRYAARPARPAPAPRRHRRRLHRTRVRLHVCEFRRAGDRRAGHRGVHPARRRRHRRRSADQPRRSRHPHRARRARPAHRPRSRPGRRRRRGRRHRGAHPGRCRARSHRATSSAACSSPTSRSTTSAS